MIIAIGAEAILRKEDGKIIKERIKKSYRLSEIDEKLRTRRTKLEANLLREAARIGVRVPRVFDTRKYEIEIEEVEGDLVKDSLDNKNFEFVGEQIGDQLAKLHEYNIIHGDLTTSNMILKNGDIFFIDFGLGFNSMRIEDKAIDLYLLHHSIEATHWDLLEIVWNVIVTTYKNSYKDGDKVIKTLHEIEKRGRYKNKAGS